MEPSKEDFKWFGEGFEGFPKQLPEDCVEYSLYIINAKLSTDTNIRDRLREVQKASTELSRRLLKTYIWQREAFGLKLVRENGEVCCTLYRGLELADDCCRAGSSFLRGRTNHGDSVEDEWLIVYLLRELSKSFADLWIKVVDTDGEFLLIEAANTLPRWLNPEIADNRVRIIVLSHLECR